ncbi:MAG: SusC/RagA family TonB-linked outer membrane protein, partial [Flavisolibacter sp.]
VNTELTSSSDQLTEVVVQVPYGTIKKTAFTGSEATIGAKTLAKQQVVSVTNAIEGLVPGVIATNGGGAPGSNAASLLIRGVGSINASSAPLFVLNGVPYDGSISSIPIDDIESVTVLKDASAAALYGSRAANGVIMIITKKGRKGRNVVTANVREGLQTRGIPEYDEVGAKDYYELFWEAYRNSYLYGPNQANYTPASAGLAASNILTTTSGLVYNAYNVPGNTLVDPTTGKLNPSAQQLYNESWANALYRTAQQTTANLSISGGTDKTDYYISGGYLDQQGVLRFSGYQRYNIRMNVNTAATDWLNVGVNLDGSSEKRNDLLSGGTATSNPFYYSREMGPIYPVYQHDPTSGAFVIDPATGKPALDWGTPAQMGTRPYAGNSNLLGSLALDDRSRYIFNGNANTYAEVKFLRSFSFKTTVGLNYFANNATTYQNNQFGDAAPTPGQANGGRSTKTYDRQFSITANEVLTWNKSYGEHNIRALVGHENYKYQYNYLSANKSGFQFPGQTELDNGTTSFSPASSYQIDHRIESYFAGVNYDYRQKYLLSASYRTDGSSRFRDSVRWGNFYSAGLGYRISQEDFLKSISWINDLKLKASYGEQGNENLGGLYYPYRLYYYANGDGTYAAPTRPASPDLMWETNKTFNAGVDFSILKNRLQGTVEYFNRMSDNLLFDVPLPPSTGNASVYENIGSMKNYGVELQLGYNAIRAKNFDWRVDVNLTHFTNKITKLPPGQPTTKGIITGTKKLLVGHGIYDFWLPEFAGVDAANGDALYYKDVLDANGKPTGQRVLTNVYNQATFYYHGSAIPKFSGGITNSFRYKNFDLSFLLTFAYGGLYYDANYASIMHRGTPGIAWSTDILNRWQKPGDITNVPRLQVAISGQDGASTRWLVDGSYLNVKNITLSYTIPGNIAKRLHLASLQVYGNVDNAYLFTAKKGLDPQRSFAGTADATYPPYRSVTFGLNISLQ